ncbi:MAG TPA: hypothetical protein VGA20_02485, partial [Gemmatimonadales bacterium]
DGDPRGRHVQAIALLAEPGERRIDLKRDNARSAAGAGPDGQSEARGRSKRICELVTTVRVAPSVTMTVAGDRRKAPADRVRRAGRGMIDSPVSCDWPVLGTARATATSTIAHVFPRHGLTPSRPFRARINPGAFLLRLL